MKTLVGEHQMHHDHTLPSDMFKSLNGTVVAKVRRDMIEDYVAPRVVREPPPTIDQMVASALSRLRVSIEAECAWATLKVKREFDESRQQLLPDPTTGLRWMQNKKGESLYSYNGFNWHRMPTGAGGVGGAVSAEPLVTLCAMCHREAHSHPNDKIYGEGWSYSQPRYPG